MKKMIFSTIVAYFAIYTLLLSATIEVCLSGTKDFAGIQQAIDRAVSGDIILVHPGVYRENLTITQKSITLQSLFATTQDTTYIHDTVISGSPTHSAILVQARRHNQDGIIMTHATIDGFTIMNNESGSIARTFVYGGGIYLILSSATIRNNIITQCHAGFDGGGINIRGGMWAPAYFEVDVHLENNRIFNNTGLRRGGGLVIDFPTNITFCPTNRNSIYDNYSTEGHDIFIMSSLVAPSNISLYLDKGSRLISEIDYFYIDFLNLHSTLEPSPIDIDILRESLPPVVNANIYVSPNGDDNNTGLSASDALKTIDRATRIVARDQDNPKSIVLVAGVYSPALNGQKFPLILPGDVNLIGSGIDETIINGGNRHVMLGSTHRHAHNEIKNLTIANFGGQFEAQATESVLKIYGGSVKLSNLLFTGNYLSRNGFTLVGVLEATIEDVTIKDSRGGAFGITNVERVAMKNVKVDNLHDSFCWSYLSRFADVKDLLVTNLTITNNHINGSQILLEVVSSLNNNYERTATLNNVLIANNIALPNPQVTVSGPNVSMGDFWGNITLNNWTMANNIGGARAASIGHRSFTNSINNSIFYNPDVVWQNEVTGIANIYYSLIYKVNPADYGDRIVQSWLNISPIFAGMVDERLTPDMVEYYFLHKTSPCIDAGMGDISHLNLPPFDLIGNQRIFGDRIDMGAFEYDSEPYISVEDETDPKFVGFNLQNYPNPFNPSTTISFSLAKTESISLSVYNVKGQLVKTLVSGAFEAGDHLIAWNGEDSVKNRVSSGIYFYRLETDSGIETKKMLLMK